MLLVIKKNIPLLPHIFLYVTTVGQPTLPTFKLLGIDDNFYENKDFNKNGNLGIVFLSNHCRISQKFQDHLIEIKQKVQNTENDFFAVSPNLETTIAPDEQSYSEVGDSFEEMKLRSRFKNYNFHFLYDGKKQKLTNGLNVNVTPMAFVFNSDRKMVYRGRIGRHDGKQRTNDMDFYKALTNDNTNKNLIQTPTYGSAIKSVNDIGKTEAKIKRYSKETIKLSILEKRNVDFIKNIGIGKLKLIYIWTKNDADNRHNLLSISNIHKIYRKRGLAVITICIDQKENCDLIKRELENSQMSAINYLIEGKDFSPLSTLLSQSIKALTPFCVLMKQNTVIYQKDEKIDKLQLRRKIVSLLE